MRVPVPGTPGAPQAEPSLSQLCDYALSLELPQGFLALFHGSRTCFVLLFSNVLSSPFHSLPHSPTSCMSSRPLPLFSHPLSSSLSSPPSPPVSFSTLTVNTPKVVSSPHALIFVTSHSLPHFLFPSSFAATLFILLSYKPPS